jgi:hypothetical protein
MANGRFAEARPIVLHLQARGLSDDGTYGEQLRNLLKRLDASPGHL